MTGTAVAPIAPEDEKLKGWLTKAEPEIAKLLPKHMRAETMVKAALVCAVRNTDIAQCTRESLLLAVMKAAHLGLEIGEDIHLVPINQKYQKPDGTDAWRKICEAWPDYRGLMKLAMQGGLVRHMVPYVVLEGERFEVTQGLNENLVHVPTGGTPGKIVAAYVIITLRYGAKTFHVMPIAEIEARRAKSKQWSKGQPLAWYCKKTVIRDWLARQPKTAKLAEALELEESDAAEPVALPAGVTEDGEVMGEVVE